MSGSTNLVDRHTMNCFIYASQGKFMGIAKVKFKIEWITKNAEEIPIEDMLALRKWEKPTMKGD